MKHPRRLRASMRVPWVLVGLVLPSVANATTAQDVERLPLLDPAGDAGLQQTPVPHAFDWGDIVEAWFEEDQATFTLKVRVSNPNAQLVDGIVAVEFLAGTGYYFAGYAAGVAPGVIIREGFYCPSDGQGNPTGECPSVPDASYSNGLYTIPGLSRETFGLQYAGDVLTEITAESGHFVLFMVWERVDWADDAIDYAFHTGAARADKPAADPGAPPPEAEAPPANPEPAAEPVGKVRGGDAPSVGFVALLVTIVAFVAAHRRR